MNANQDGPVMAIGEAPEIIRMQPYPIQVFLATIRVGPFSASAVARLWEDGETSRCSLCPRCKASRNACVVLVSAVVTRESAPLLSLRRDRPIDTARRVESTG